MGSEELETGARIALSMCSLPLVAVKPSLTSVQIPFVLSLLTTAHRDKIPFRRDFRYPADRLAVIYPILCN